MKNAPKPLDNIPFEVLRSVICKTKRDGDCWIFTGAKTPKGYGKINILGKDYGAHRVIFSALKRHLEANEYVHHTCFNTSCVNPDHLEATNIQYNTAERNHRRSIVSF